MRINQALEAEKKLAAENPQSVPCLEEDEDFSVLDAKLAALDAEEAKLDARDLRALAVLARYGGKTYEELYISWDVEWERISAICDLLQTGKVTAEEETLLLQYLKRRQEWTSELDSIISGGTPFAKYQNPTLKKRLDDTLAAHKQVR
ncbi:MAG: hypothetical protein LBC83_08395 [Oscillospiraceae bacterium]|nr:hypothetical protein [Oscillospiraceae bacterium]